jgi:MFS family permease
VLPFGAQLTVGAFLSATGLLSIALFHDHGLQLAAAAAALGLGTGLVTSSTPNLIVRSVPGDQVGIATGMNANIRTIGGAIGTTVFAAAIGATLGADGLPAESGYVAAFVIGGALAIVGGVVPFLGRARAGRPAARAIPVVDSPLEKMAEAA